MQFCGEFFHTKYTQLPVKKAIGIHNQHKLATSWFIHVLILHRGTAYVRYVHTSKNSLLMFGGIERLL